MNAQAQAPYRQDELDALQEQMRERGVVDVKIAYSTERLQQLREAVIELDRVRKVMVDDTITFIQAVLDGKTTPHTGIGDSVRGEIKE